MRLLNEAFSPGLAFIIRIFFATVLSYFLFYKQIDFQKIKHFSLATWGYFILIGSVGYSLSIYFLSLGVLRASLISVAVILGTSPIWTYMLSLIFLKTKVKNSYIIYLLITVIGVMLLSLNFAQMNDLATIFSLGSLFLLISAVSGCVFYVFRNKLPTELNDKEISFLMMGIASLSSVLFLFTETPVIHYDHIFTWQILVGLTIGISFNIFINWAQSYSFKILSPVFGAQLLLLENVFALILGYLLYSETFGLFQFIGMVLVISCAYFMSKDSS